MTIDANYSYLHIKKISIEFYQYDAIIYSVIN
ncbi:hypothetical protein Cassandra_0387 [Pseudomonas phage Cassandra]|nr:hypothetical protein Cassandra_0387 [Pseudomonas phage Cassandra]